MNSLMLRSLHNLAGSPKYGDPDKLSIEPPAREHVATLLLSGPLESGDPDGKGTGGFYFFSRTEKVIMTSRINVISAVRKVSVCG